MSHASSQYGAGHALTLSQRRLQYQLQRSEIVRQDRRGGEHPRSLLRRCGKSAALPADVCSSPGGSRRLHPGFGLGEGPGREPGRPGARALLHPAAAGEELRRAERLADGQMHRLRQGAFPSGASRSDRVGGVRGGTAEAGRVSWSLRWLPRGGSLGVEDLPGSLRQQQILGERQCGRPAGRDPRLCRSDRHPPGWAHRRGTRRSYSRGETIYDPWHYVPVLARKPGALRNGAPFRDWVLPAALERVRRRLAGSDDGDRQMVAILAAVLTDGLPAVEAACAQAMAEGVHSSDVIINILTRHRDPGPTATILTPDALTLRHMPIADCARYDQLRSR